MSSRTENFVLKEDENVNYLLTYTNCLPVFHTKSSFVIIIIIIIIIIYLCNTVNDELCT